MNAKPQTPCRRPVICMLSLFLVMAGSRAAASYRTFTDTRNRTFSGALKAFDATSRTVTIQRSDGKTGDMPLAVFCESDREYITRWGVTNDFFQGLKLAVELESVDPPKEELPASARNRKIRDFYYRVQLKNGSTTTFPRLDLEYCIFYRQGERDGYTILYDEGTCYGKTKVESLAPGASQLLETKRIRLYTESGTQTLFGVADDLSAADVRGIWLRLRMKPPSGSALEREYRTVYDEICKWTPYSIGAGMNGGSSAYRLYILE